MGLGITHYLKINKNFKIREKLAAGDISEVYRVKDRDGTSRAAQFVSRRYRYFLAAENRIMQDSTLRNDFGIPSSYFFGRHGNKYVLVTDLLHHSLSLIKQQTGNFSLQAGLQAGIQMTSRLQSLHECGFIHQNISPQNFLAGSSENDRYAIFLTNYKRATKFRDTDGSHMLPTWGLSFQGSKDFASRHAHKGERQSRRCDLESVAYCITYLMKGLPWESLPVHDLSGTAAMKEQISPEELCGGLPWEIMRYYVEVRDLSYSASPNYSRLCGYLRSALFRNGFAVDGQLEWTH